MNTYNSIYDDNLTLSDIKHWNIHEIVKPECGKDIYGCITETMLNQLKPQPYAQEITDKLMDEGHDLYIVTATQSRFVMSKQYWIDKYFPRLKDKLIITNFKSLISGLELLIDDQPTNIELFPNEVITMDYAWNRSLKRDCPRAKDWNDIYRIIYEIDDEKKKHYITHNGIKHEISDKDYNRFVDNYNKPIKELREARARLITRLNVVEDAEKKIEQIDKVIENYYKSI